MTFIAASKKNGVQKYWVFRGWTLAADGTTRTNVAWANVALATATGAVQGRLLDLAPVTRGMPERIGGRPELPSWTLVLDNSDKALDDILGGKTSSAKALDEYKANSVLNLQGQLYRGVVDTDGTVFEQKMTPTMGRRGRIRYADGKASIPMSGILDYVLGHGKLAFTVSDVRSSKSQNPDTLVSFADGVFCDKDGTTGVYTQATVDTDLAIGSGQSGGWKDNLSESADFLYGKCAIPLVTVQNTHGGSDVQAFCFLSLKEPIVEDFAAWQFFIGSHSQPTPVRLEYSGNSHVPRLIKVKRWMKDTAGVWQGVWLCFAKFQFYSRTNATADVLYSGQRLWLVPFGNSNGVAAPLDTLDEIATPTNIVRRLIIDHGAQGVSGIDTASFNAGRRAIPPAGLAGGMYNAGTNVWEIASHLAQAFGFSLWVGCDDAVHVLVHGTWSQTDAAALAAGSLPELGIADVFGEWAEEMPDGATGELGGPATLTTMQWSDDQRAFWDDWNLPKQAPGNTKLPLGAIVEAALSGAWVYPPTAASVLSIFADRQAFATRRITFRTHGWVASYELGQVFLITYPRGLNVEGSTGYVRRPMRLERIEVDPNSDRSIVTFEDLGPASETKPGVLDDIAHWIAKTPAPGDTLTLSAGSANVVASANIFDITDVGRTLVTRGASNEANQGPNRKITVFTDAKHVTVNFAYPSNDVITMAGSGIDATWQVLDNHSSKVGYDAKYIRLAKESTGLFLNADPAYTFD